jgi:hypothetical protein
METIKKEDIEWLETAKKYSLEIADIYDVLINLDLHGKKYTSQYSDYLKNLKILLNQEKKCYCIIDFKNAVRLINILNNDFSLEKYANLDTEFYQENNQKRIERRIFYNLLNCLFENPKAIAKVGNILINKELKTNNMPFTFDSKTIYKILITKAISNDLLQVYLDNIEDYIYANKFKQAKKDLIPIKYNMSFLHSDLENILLENNFEIDKPIYVSSDVYSTHYKLKYNLVSPFYSDNIYLTNNKYLILDIISKIIFLNDNDFKEKNNVIKAIKYESYLRSLLLLLNKEDIETLKSLYIDTFLKDNYESNKIGINLVNYSFNKSLENKQNIVFLSLGVKHGK